jgi:hypothetical protein
MNKERHGYLEAGFGKINKNIDKLFNMKDKTVGWGIFESHKYTSTQLLNSSEFDKIRSTAEKIASDITNWEQNNQLDISTKRVYNTNRDLLENRIKRLEDAIRNRAKTWWDSVKEFFEKIWSFIIKILPRLVINLLLKMADATGLLGFFGKHLLTGNSKMNRLLTSKKDIFITEND